MTRATCVRIGIATAAAALLLACGGGEETPSPATAPAPPAAGQPTPQAPAAAPTPAPSDPVVAARTEAQRIFSTRCATCHGVRGAGDGPGATGLTPGPRNFQDPAWQASVSDSHIETIVKLGGAAVGKSPLMPPNPDLQSRPEVVAALRQYVRSLAR